MDKNKTLKTGIIVCTVSVIFIVGLTVLLTFLGGNIKPKSEVFEDAEKYAELMDKNGNYRNRFLSGNEIFPENLAEDALVEVFRLEYKQPYDEKYNYMAYLVYTCNDEEFEAECLRLSKIKSTSEDDYKDVYGITGFGYTTLAVCVDENYGISYVMCMEESKRLIYFALSFNDYYTDIDYLQSVNSMYLPKGFNAYIGNTVYDEHRKDK